MDGLGEEVVRQREGAVPDEANLLRLEMEALRAQLANLRSENERLKSNGGNDDGDDTEEEED